jgi:hypothetical protein
MTPPRQVFQGGDRFYDLRAIFAQFSDELH